MTPDDAVKFDAFLADYRTHGNGSLGISVPDGPASRAAITYFAERAAATGISRDKILVSTHEVANGDTRVEISYIAYTAHAAACGGLVGRSGLHRRQPDAAGISAARCSTTSPPWWPIRAICLGPGGMGPVDTARRATVMDHYEKGEDHPGRQAHGRQGDRAVRRRLHRWPVTHAKLER